MIDILSEQLISPAQYTKMRPPGRNGRPMNLATFYRHVYNGLRGIRLEHVKLGGNTYTSIEAAQRFAERLTEARSAPPTDAPRAAPPLPREMRTAAARLRAVEAANRELERAGI